MRGSIYQKKTNMKYYPIIYLGVDDMTGKENRKWGHGWIKKKDAESELRKLLNDYDNDDIETGSDTFKYVYDLWIETVAPAQYKSADNLETSKCYAECHILPIWGKKKLASIEAQQLQKFFINLPTSKTKDLKKDEQIQLRSQTKKKILSIMRSVFNLAIEYRFLNKSPADKILIADDKEKSEYEIWSYEELDYFLNLDIVKDSPYYICFLIALTCGMRRGEISGLQWKDFSDGSLFAQRGLDRKGNVTNMKTKAAHRRIELMDKTLLALEQQKAKQKQWSKAEGYLGSNFVCTREDGSIIRPVPISDNFKRLVTKNNNDNEYQLPLIRLHDLRHTFATSMLKKNINTKVVSEILGHTDTRTTQMIYQEVLPTMQREARGNLENAYFENPVRKAVRKKKEA